MSWSIYDIFIKALFGALHQSYLSKKMNKEEVRAKLDEVLCRLGMDTKSCGFNNSAKNYVSC